jgi:superfamily II RNA helicase
VTIPNFSTLDLNNLFPFALDDFQKQAIAALNANKSVVVCAPTGSGKTLVGEYAIYRALSRGKRVFYTTPLKALSNQKLRDFRQQFGSENVGLLTGDVCINRDAAIVVMTTEIFRNMLYGTPIGEVGTSLLGLEAVVLDECHYMNDKDRGTVWEESIIYCPKNIQLVALSATVDNSEELTDWLCQVHGETELIYSDYRPVPLDFHFCSPKGVFPLLNDNKSGINSRLKEKKTSKDFGRGRKFADKFEGESVVHIFKNWQERKLLPNIYYVYGRKGCDRILDDLHNVNLLTPQQLAQINTYLEEFGKYNPEIWKQRRLKDLIDSLRRGIGIYHLEMSPLARSLVTAIFQSGLLQVLITPETLYTVTQMHQREMLPAIYFIFSRVGCDLAVQECYLAVEELKLISLVTPEEIEKISQKIDEFLANNPDAQRNDKIAYLYRGIAAHHAGILPAWKSLIEELFAEGLIKVVFATETLAAGINMPARTTVISSLSKRTDDGHRLLKASEFLQMSGRAGRRGKDIIGNVVTLQTPFEGAEIAANLATKRPDPLISQFTPTYGMVLNLLQTHPLSEIKELIEKSFGQYLGTLNVKPDEENLLFLREQLAKIEQEVGDIDWEQISNYDKLQQRLKVEKHLLKTLVQQAEREQDKQVSSAMIEAELGTIVYLKGKHILTAFPIPAVLIEKIPGSGKAPYLICLSKDNKWYVCSTADVIDYEPNNILKKLPVPPLEFMFKLGEKRKGSEKTLEFVKQIPQIYTVENTPPEVTAQMERLETVKTALENHIILQWGEPQKLLHYQQQREICQEEIRDLEEKIAYIRAKHWQEFLDLISILQHTGALESLQPTALGEAAAAIRGENELWLGMALMSGELDHLDPHHLAATCCALVSETPRPESWTNYPLSPEVDAVISSLRSVKKGLIQVQYRYHVNLPLWLESELVGLVEKWALGEKWLELCQNTSLDEGDLVRMIRRTLDLLSQISRVPNLADSLKKNAIRAIQLIDKFPVNELIS